MPQTAGLCEFLHFLFVVFPPPPSPSIVVPNRGWYSSICNNYLSPLGFFPFWAFSDLRGAGKLKDHTWRTLLSKNQSLRLSTGVLVLLWVTCPKFTSPILAIQRSFVFDLSSYLYSSRWQTPWNSMTCKKAVWVRILCFVLRISFLMSCSLVELPPPPIPFLVPSLVLT